MCVERVGFPHPEVEPVPRLLLNVDAVGLGSANGPYICLMALLEVDELNGERRTISKRLCRAMCVAVLNTREKDLTSSPICGTKGERRGTVSIIHDGGSHSSAFSPASDDVGFWAKNAETSVFFRKRSDFTVNAAATDLDIYNLFGFFGFFLLLLFLLLCLIGLITAVFLFGAAVTSRPYGPPGRPLWWLEVDPGISRPVRIFTGRVAANPIWRLLAGGSELPHEKKKKKNGLRIFTWSCFHSATGLRPQRRR